MKVKYQIGEAPDCGVILADAEGAPIAAFTNWGDCIAWQRAREWPEGDRTAVQDLAPTTERSSNWLPRVARGK